MRLSVRDHWIGWTHKAAEERLRTGEWGWRQLAETLTERLDWSIDQLRSDDLAIPQELATPTENLIFRLRQQAYGAACARERQLREFYDQNRASGCKSHKGLVIEPSEDVDWLAASEDFLFVRKRAEFLSELLLARMTFNGVTLLKDPEAALRKLFASKQGRKALDVALAEFRKAGLASQIADVSVCGAVHPYSEILGGKLVTLLLASSEARQFYAERYGEHISLIASQLAGRAIRRPAELCMLTTTSLYGVGSSQYNRLKLRADEHHGLGMDIAWQALGRRLTAGFGTVHLGDDTVQALRG